MNIDGHTILNIVNIDTRYTETCIMRDESTNDIWNAMTRIWFHPYIGYPDIIAHDQGTRFTGMERENILRTHGIKSQTSGVKSYNVVGTNERYHFFLRPIFHKIRADNPTFDVEIALSIATKAINDTAGPAGLGPTILVFVEMPRIPIRSTNLKKYITQMAAMGTARRKMTKVVARCRIETAVQCSAPAAAENYLKIGDEVLMFCEKPTEKWVGPYVISDKKNKALLLGTGDRLIPAYLDKVKRYLQPDASIHNNPDITSSTFRNSDVNESTEQFEKLMDDISNGNTNS